MSGVANAVILENTSGDPNLPDFYLLNFYIGDAETTGTNPPVLVGGCDAASMEAATPSGTCTLTPGFSVAAQDISFSIGLDLATDDTAPGSSYQATTYSGSFEVTAAY